MRNIPLLSRIIAIFLLIVIFFIRKLKFKGAAISHGLLLLAIHPSHRELQPNIIGIVAVNCGPWTIVGNTGLSGLLKQQGLISGGSNQCFLVTVEFDQWQGWCLIWLLKVYCSNFDPFSFGWFKFLIVAETSFL